MMHASFWFNNNYGMDGPLAFIFFPIAVWTIVWKGIALWKAAQKEEKVWFVILLLVNTLGILEILYIYLFSKKQTKKNKSK